MQCWPSRPTFFTVHVSFCLHRTALKHPNSFVKTLSLHPCSCPYDKWVQGPFPEGGKNAKKAKSDKAVVEGVPNLIAIAAEPVMPEPVVPATAAEPATELVGEKTLGQQPPP